jgi:hypothetical protein
MNVVSSASCALPHDSRHNRRVAPLGSYDQVDALGLIGQVLNKMHAGALPKPPEKMRCMNGMTMDEAWDLARPKRPGTDARI